MSLHTSGWSCYIENLYHWVPGGGGWRKYAPGGTNDLHLRIYHDFLLIAQSGTAVESFNLASTKMKGFVKGSTLILAISSQDKSIRKIKLQFTCSLKSVTDCVRLLVQYMPVEDRNTKKLAGIQAPHRFITIESTLQRIMEKGNNELMPQMPAQYKDFVRMCILDPAFPRLVSETELAVKGLLE